ncbi:MmpS family transport accessory protein [Sinomonas gamaensis]|uniref:MmpS family transport accessory protein n=1 Tax=Sinomonas gamaensis TaxID=2565624 RepID=UPI0011081AB9|nr:MmpS family transport accessory protein [Sinomonas gamaensis]
MSSSSGAPIQEQPLYGAPQPPRPSAALAIVALVLGAIAFLFSFIPVVNFIAFVLGLAAFICALIALIRKLGGKVMAIIGLVLAVIAFVIAVIVNVVVAAAVSSASTEISKSLATYSAKASAQHSIQYKVTTSGAATVHYWTPDGTSQTDVTANWSKDVASTGFTSALVSVTSSDFQDKSASVSCEIIVDGKSVAKNTGSGALATASCNATAG